MWCELLGFESRWNARTWVASVVPDFAAKLWPFEHQKHFVDFIHSSTNSQRKGLFWFCDELFVPSDNADFLACEPSQIIQSPGNDFVPPFFPQAAHKAGQFRLVTSCHAETLNRQNIPPFARFPSISSEMTSWTCFCISLSCNSEFPCSALSSALCREVTAGKTR